MHSFFNKPAVAALMSFLLPGLGQATGGRARRGFVIAIPAFAMFIAFAIVLVFARSQFFDGLVSNPGLMVSLLIVDALTCLYHLFAVFDAYLGQSKPKMRQPGMRGITVERRAMETTVPILLFALVATVGFHAYLGALEIKAQNQHACTVAGTCDTAQSGAATPTLSATPGRSAVVSPSPGVVRQTGTPVPQKAQAWVAISDKVKVRTAPGVNYTVITTIAKGVVVGGWVVEGGPYTVDGVTRTDWIELDQKPISSRFVAMAFFAPTTAEPGTTVLETPTPLPSSSGPEAP